MYTAIYTDWWLSRRNNFLLSSFMFMKNYTQMGMIDGTLKENIYKQRKIYGP